MYALAKSQACVDGNKRVALLLVDAFVLMNGFRLNTQPGDLADLILELAEADPREREQTVENAAAWMRSKLVVLNGEEN